MKARLKDMSVHVQCMIRSKGSQKIKVILRCYGNSGDSADSLKKGIWPFE